MKLADWLKANSISAYAFADEIKAKSRTSIYQYIDPEKLFIPEREMMAKIWVKTNGAVAPNDFYDLPALTKPKPPKPASKPRRLASNSGK